MQKQIYAHRQHPRSTEYSSVPEDYVDEQRRFEAAQKMRLDEDVELCVATIDEALEAQADS